MKHGTILSSWLNDNSCFIKRGDTKITSTHTCMDGGALAISDSMAFSHKYAEGLLYGDKYFVCERATDVIQMYLDLDFCLPDSGPQVDIGLIKGIAANVRSVTGTYFNENFAIIACTSASKKVDGDKTKSGVHVIVQDLYINRAQAPTLSKEVIKSLQRDFPKFKWKEIVDIQVYGSGLRMIGSRKMIHRRMAVTRDDTNTGSTDKRADVEVVEIDEGRAYWPIFKLMNSNEFESVPALEDMSSLRVITTTVCECSIRAEPGIRAMTTCESKTLRMAPAILKKPSSRKPTDDVHVDASSFEMIRCVIRGFTIPQWGNIEITGIKREKHSYLINVAGGWCINAQKEHNSRDIYLVLTKKGMYQGCFCKCETTEGRLHGLCRDFKSEYKRVPEGTLLTLFPNHVPSDKPVPVPDSILDKEITDTSSTWMDYNPVTEYDKSVIESIIFLEGICSNIENYN